MEITLNRYTQILQISFHNATPKPQYRLKKLPQTRNIIIRVERVVERNGIILFPINCDRIIDEYASRRTNAIGPFE